MAVNSDALSVLLIEDNPDDVRLLQRALPDSQPRIDLTVADTMAAGLLLAASRRFDAVLLDLTLPDCSGLDTISQATEAITTVPIIVLTSSNDEAMALGAMQKGAQDYLMKGHIDRPALTRALRYAIERKNAQLALRKAHNELEVRVEQRTAELGQTVRLLRQEVVRRSAAEEAMAAQSQQLRLLAGQITLAEQRERRRLADMLHDNLQQLLVAASMQSDLLHDELEDPPQRKRAAHIRSILNESIELSRSLSYELCPPILRQAGLIAALQWLIRHVRQKYGLEVQLEGDECSLHLPEDLDILLFQAARELLFNVVKHADVKKALLRLALTDDSFSMLICDEGVGFDPALSQPAPGAATGFGLFSIQERLALCGGRMEIDSRPCGEGSCLTVTVPHAIPAEEPLRPAEMGASATAPVSTAKRTADDDIRVILVDDHQVLRHGLVNLLERAVGMRVVGEAADGESAVALVRRERPDVVLMDYSLPGISGVEATRMILASQPEVSIIGLSMFEEAERAAAMREAGAVAYLTKSGKPEAIIAAIRTACSKSQVGASDHEG